MQKPKDADKIAKMIHVNSFITATHVD